MATQGSIPAAEQLRLLFRCLETQDGFVETVAALQAGKTASFDGAWGSSCALLAAALQQHASGPFVIVCPQVDDVDEFCEDLSLFSAIRPLKFPAWEGEPSEQLVRDEIYGERLRTLKLLASGHSPTRSVSEGESLRESLRGNDFSQAEALPAAPSLTPRVGVIVTSIQSLLQPVPSREMLAGNTHELNVGDRLDVDGFLKWLTEQRFQATTGVALPGEFSRRGGIMDLFAPDWDQPVRVELFDDEIESIRRFDLATQRSLEALDAVEVTVLGGVRDTATAHLSDYLPRNAWVLLVEPRRIQEAGEHFLERVERKAEFHLITDVLRELGRFAMATAATLNESTAETACHLRMESVERFSGDFERVRGELDRVGEGHDVFITARTEAEIKRLGEIFSNTQVAATKRLHFVLGSLRTGFRLEREHILVITGGELFHREEVRRVTRRHLGKAIDSFLDLNEGDLVVHLSHGIGRYRGLRLLEKQGHKLEHLVIEFAEGTKIFVPAAKIDLVQKYVGGTKSRPRLAKIGGQLWGRHKKAAEAAVVDMAAELLDLQAARQSRPGIAFGPDSDWQQAFDASFPYQETPDQLLAMEAIKTDMQRSRPMDRLLCGDVGFGKTEVAMRAVFKAVDNGFQVAVLVPTTILAEQHYHTFKERMAEFPFDVGRLSRFCEPQEEREVIAGLKTGRIDIVIGTHRLASSDVEFHNLGLVIIDEEQRFGVEVKERLKALRATVDVLTMSATPIPRTLHMSLVGVRDISNLETAPTDRVAVETKVTRFNHELIRHAVLQELNRGGQIFFVHNRVEDIAVLAQKLKYIVPEVSIRIGHGQMPEHELEEVMASFIAHRFDLLLATTIVESGLDIPNANTIFIDEADRYGLSDLHQLRGRVGRYKHRAHCYLLIDPVKYITPNAAKRLRAIEEFSELGAGFAVAMRDLEIRGAGNLLGSQQSGHIAAVGYELYCQLLENAVRSLRKEPPKISLDVDIDLPGQAYIPAEYIPDIRQKIDAYRRIARISAVHEIADMRTELLDRFGKIPDSVLRMLSLAELKIDAAVWQVGTIRLEEQYMVFDYSHRGRIDQLARLNRGKLRVVDGKSAYLTPPSGAKPDQLVELAKSVLRPK